MSCLAKQFESDPKYSEGLTSGAARVEMHAFKSLVLQRSKRVIKTDARLLQSTIMLGLLVGLTACKGTDGQQASNDSPAPSEQSIEAEQETVPYPMNLNGQIAFAMKDLAQRQGVDQDSVKFSGAQKVTWRSGALGCPKPGMMYTEALVPGSVIYLQVDQVSYGYHAKVASEPFYCPRERAEQPALGDENDLT